MQRALDPALPRQVLVQRLGGVDGLREEHLRAAPDELLGEGGALAEGRRHGDGGELLGGEFVEEDAGGGRFGDGEFGGREQAGGLEVGVGVLGGGEGLRETPCWWDLVVDLFALCGGLLLPGGWGGGYCSRGHWWRLDLGYQRPGRSSFTKEIGLFRLAPIEGRTYVFDWRCLAYRHEVGVGPEGFLSTVVESVARCRSWLLSLLPRDAIRTQTTVRITYMRPLPRVGGLRREEIGCLSSYHPQN